ncbi:FIG00482387: hypothetical protein [hydrothermal vent metagenome]|uniref:Uncharacterized protein n=1 Tax=hydrothermal vent metagenome TaxID=652676 RepID=A0A3B0SMU9_9ZZZZ
MRTPLLLALGSALVLGACATATPYQAAQPGVGGLLKSNVRGFSEQQIEKNRYRVSFAGNSLTDQQTVENYLLFRAAELTTQQGFDHFVIAERTLDKKERYQNSGGYGGFGGGYGGHFGWSYYSPYYGFGHSYGHGFGYGGGYGRGYGNSFNIRQITRYQASAEIVLGNGPKPDDNERAYDAHDVLEKLAGKIVRPEVQG